MADEDEEEDEIMVLESVQATKKKGNASSMLYWPFAYMFSFESMVSVRV